MSELTPVINVMQLHYVCVCVCVLFLCAGIAVGHSYYFLVDVFPKKQGGFEVLKTPQFM